MTYFTSGFSRAVIGFLATGCEGEFSPRDSSAPTDARSDALSPRDAPVPQSPSVDDPAYRVSAPRWLMAGDGLTPRSETLDVSVTAEGEARSIEAWIDGARVAALTRGADGVFRAALPAPAAGEHVLTLAADGSPTGFASRAVRVSAALYAVVSVDWDDANPFGVNLTRMEALRAHHPRLLYTQFIGPYVFTDASTSEARRQELIGWIGRQREAGDELGVHIHPRCTFVSTTGVPCRSRPSTVNPEGDPSGYTVIFAAYSVEEQAELLRSASELMVRHGFARPLSFRAGGWTAQASTLEACDRAGYRVESSAFPPETIQRAWAGTELARWNLANWAGITPTSQPYHPSRARLVSAEPPPNFAALEVPDNGSLVDYMSAAAMIEVFNQNFPMGASLATPRVFQVGLHPGSYGAGNGARLEGALGEVDRHLFAEDAGPVVYARLTELTRVWP